MLKLYVKIGEEYKELSALAVGPNLQVVEKVKIEDAIESYLEKYTAKKSKCTRTNEKNYFKNLAEFLTIEKISFIDEISVELINKYKSKMLIKVSPSTVNRQFNTIKNFFNLLHKKQYIFKNPCSEIIQEKIQKPKIHLWTDEDLALVKNGLDEHTQAIIQFMYLTGARNIEAVNLTWTDIDQKSGLITFRSRKNAEHYRTFPISDEASKLLHNIKFKGLYVFGSGNKFTSDSLGKKVKKSVKENCINKNITVYGLRHTFCKDLLKKGLSKPLIQKFMGHKDWRTTEIYTHWDTDHLINVLNLIR